jgi:broad specificity phosphatase PhoE
MAYLEVREWFGRHAAERLQAPCRLRAHGGETLTEVADRVALAWDELPLPADGCCAVVSHATPMQVLLFHLLQMPLDRYWQLRIDLASLTRVMRHPAGAVVQFTNRSQ